MWSGQREKMRVQIKGEYSRSFLNILKCMQLKKLAEEEGRGGEGISLKKREEYSLGKLGKNEKDGQRRRMKLKRKRQ